MNKKEYISSLREKLVTLPSNDVEEILKEFEMHFDIGVSEGKAENEIAAKLGSPEEVAQYYLGEAVPEYNPAGTEQVAAGAFPIVPIQTWLGRPNRGTTAQTIQGFCHPTYAIPPKNKAPKPEPAGENVHQGGRAPDLSQPHPKQEWKQVELTGYEQYPSQDPNYQKPQPKTHDKAFAILFTIFVFVPVWFIALALTLLITAWPIVTGAASVTLFALMSSFSGGIFLGTLFLAIALAFAVIAHAIIAFFAIRGFILGTIAYFRWLGKSTTSAEKEA